MSSWEKVEKKSEKMEKNTGVEESISICLFVSIFLGYFSGKYKESSFSHEAGYDAYMTAVIFLSSCHALGIHPPLLKSLASTVEILRKKNEVPSPHRPPQGLVRLAHRANVVSVARTSAREIAVDFDSCREPVDFRALSEGRKRGHRREDRANVVLVWDFSEGKTISTLREDFVEILEVSPKEKDKIFVYFLDTTAALVELRNTESAKKVLEAFSEKKNGRLVNEGAKFAPFSAHLKLCQVLEPFENASSAANFLQLEWKNVGRVNHQILGKRERENEGTALKQEAPRNKKIEKEQKVEFEVPSEWDVEKK